MDPPPPYGILLDHAMSSNPTARTSSASSTGSTVKLTRPSTSSPEIPASSNAAEIDSQASRSSLRPAARENSVAPIPAMAASWPGRARTTTRGGGERSGRQRPVRGARSRPRVACRCGCRPDRLQPGWRTGVCPRRARRGPRARGTRRPGDAGDAGSRSCRACPDPTARRLRSTRHGNADTSAEEDVGAVRTRRSAARRGAAEQPRPRTPRCLP